MARPARKWILIPEYRPLFAMQECFGPQHGPLKEPCPTPIPIIGKLLRQSGDDKLTIYEVKMNPDRTTTDPILLTLDNYTLPYDEIVGGKKVEPGPSLESTQKDPEAVPPVIGNFGAADPEKEEDKNPSAHVEPEEPAAPESEVTATDDEQDPPAVAMDDTPEVPIPEPTEEEEAEISNDDVAESDTEPEQEEAEEELASATAETEQSLPPEPEVTVTSQDGVEVEGISPKVNPYAQMSKKERKEARKKAAEAAAKAGTAQSK